MAFTTRNVLPVLQPLCDLAEERPECFASGSEDIRAAALAATKFLFDLAVKSEQQSSTHIIELLASLELFSAPQTRSQANNGKRKRTLSPPSRKTFETTPIASLFVDGMNEEQIWAQLDLRTELICSTLERVLEGEPDWDSEDEFAREIDTAGDGTDRQYEKALEVVAKGEGGDFDLLEGFDSDASSDSDASLDVNSQEGTTDEVLSDEGSEDDAAEDVADLRDSPSGDSEDGGPYFPGTTREVKKALRGKHPELDDGFFDLASFNKETRQLESRSSSNGQLGDKESEDEDDGEDMAIDLFAPVSVVELAGEEAVTMYRDFFEPPNSMLSKGLKSKPKAGALKTAGQVRFSQEVRVKKIRAKGKGFPLHTSTEDEGRKSADRGIEHFLQDELASNSDSDEDNISSRASRQADSPGSWNQDESHMDVIERLQSDLFADEESDPHPDLSTHEKRVAELQKQIAELESENVGPKDWVLMGEATSRSRPQNSLLEEDLEFERATKVAPLVTEERVHVLEERIKARILEGQFDDVIRRRKVDDKPFLPSRFLELKDTKSTQSLAQIYEDEFVSSRTGDAPGDDRDAKLKKEHDDIEHVWEKLCHKLDALCNAHFMPKPPKATISTVANVSAASLESALPSTKSPASMLAPEEVFAPSTTEPRARSELTPIEKRALRNKERKKRKKTQDTLHREVTKVRGIGGVKKQQKAALDSVVKMGKGVTIVGKGKKETHTTKKYTKR